MTDDDTNRQRTIEGDESYLNAARRRFLQAAGIGVAGLTGLGGFAAGQSDGEANHVELEAVEIEVGGGRGRSEYAWEDGEEGVVRGPPEAVCDAVGGSHVWMGVAPGSVEDVVNPTLEVTAGETYTVEWTNTDGETHSFVVVDADGNELVSSDDLSEEGESQTVEFEATEAMAEYYCGTHPSSQQGSVEVGETGAASFDVGALDPETLTINAGDAFDVSASVTNVGDGSGTQTVTLSVDGSTVDSMDVSLDAGGETTVSFEGMDSSDLAEGDHAYVVATDDDDASGTLTVEAGPVDPIQFTETAAGVPNGAWTWYTSERCIVDPDASRVLVGSVSAGGTASGDIVVHWHDVDDDETGHVVLHEGLEQDDHDDPSLFLRPDGRYLATYAGHNSDSLTRWRITEEPHDPTSWADEQTFENEEVVTYSNVHRLPADDDGAGRTYNFTRTRNWDPNVLVSTDQGSSWSYGGRLLQRGGGGDRPYLRYASDDEAIHFIATEEHPRQFDNNIYHGYVSDGTLYDSSGTVVEADVLDGTASAPGPTDLTTVFETGTEYDDTPMTRAWTVDVTIDDDGYPVAVFVVRADDDWQDHRFFYARFDGTGWQAHHVTEAGVGLYDSERDYTGLASIDPNDPSRIVVSTPVDPSDGAALDHHELFLGETDDGGATWEWTPLTPDAVQDNLRPLIPDWSDDRSALVWMRGGYFSYTSWDTQVVGTADRIRPVTPGTDPEAPISAPYGVNLGGNPDVPQSELPVVIDGLEFVPEDIPGAIDHVTVTGDSPAEVGSGTDQPIDGTEADALYQTSIYGDSLGLAVAIENGTYDVTLHFAEVFHDSPGQRVFDVSVQGELIEEEFDIVETVGNHVAHTMTITDVDVTDETLTVSMPTHVDFSLVRGIEIR